MSTLVQKWRSIDPSNRLFYIFLFCWTIAGCLQSAFMELSGEEAYYWMFAQQLEWGFLDHPPLVAFFTQLGYFWLPTNLGARLFMVLLSTGTLYVLYRTLEPRNPRLLITMALGLVAFHAGSFLIKTDVPLIFFEALFLLAYKEYLKEDGWKQILLMGISIAGMFLSKYHGALVVLLVVASYPAVAKRKSFWAVVGLVVLLMLPHTYWQYTHDWASIRFHLQGRSDITFKWNNLFNYLWSQPLMLGPLVSLVLMPAAFLYKSQDRFERALRFVFIGVLVFFLLSSIRVYIHKHWTSIALLPGLILAYNYLIPREKWQKHLRTLTLITLVLLVPARLYYAYDFVPDKWDGKLEALHNWQSWAEELDSIAGEREIVFLNSYENASRYTYMTGEPAHCVSNYFFNNTHFDYWDGEDRLQGKSVFLINNKRKNQEFKTYNTGINVQIRYREIDNYRSYSKVWVEPLDEIEDMKAGEERKLRLLVTNKHSYRVSAKNNPELPPYLGYFFLKGQGRGYSDGLTAEALELAPGESVEMELTVKAPEKPGNYQLRFGVQTAWIPATINSRRHSLKVTD